MSPSHKLAKVSIKERMPFQLVFLQKFQHWTYITESNMAKTKYLYIYIFFELLSNSSQVTSWKIPLCFCMLWVTHNKAQQLVNKAVHKLPSLSDCWTNSNLSSPCFWLPSSRFSQSWAFVQAVAIDSGTQAPLHRAILDVPVGHQKQNVEVQV